MPEEGMFDTKEACLAAGHDEDYCSSHVKAAAKPAENPTIGAEMVILKTENQELRTNLKTLTDEVKKLKAELGEANASKDADIRARLYPIIQNSIPTITRIELDEMTPKELAAFAQTLSRVDKKESPGKPNLVIASADAVSDMHVTLDRMPNMYGKSREEILKQVGV